MRRLVLIALLLLPGVALAANPPRPLGSYNDPLLFGMTREQVLMSVGYPITSENPHLDAKTWKFWLSSFAEFHVVFDDQGIVTAIDAPPDVLDTVVAP